MSPFGIDFCRFLHVLAKNASAAEVDPMNVHVHTFYTDCRNLEMQFLPSLAVAMPLVGTYMHGPVYSVVREKS